VDEAQLDGQVEFRQSAKSTVDICSAILRTHIYCEYYISNDLLGPVICLIVFYIRDREIAYPDLKVSCFS